MQKNQRAATFAFAAGMISLGILGLRYGDFALQWQPVDPDLPGRALLAYVTAALELAGGIALVFERTERAAARVFLPFMLVWLVLKARGIIAAPLIEANWLGFGEIAVLASGAWVLFARSTTLPNSARFKFLTGDKGVRIAQLFFGFWLIPIGVSHILYVKETMSLVPHWLPFSAGWAYLTGVAHIAAAAGVLCSVVPRLAARLETAMLGIFALLVWVPNVASAPNVRINWTALIITVAIAGGAWVVAASFDNTEARTG